MFYIIWLFTFARPTATRLLRREQWTPVVSLCKSDGLSVGPRYQEFRAPFFRLGCISVVTLSLWPSEPRWQLANDLCHIMIQQPVSKCWPLFHCVCFISTAIVSLQFGVGILIYIFHIFFPIFIFNSYWFVVVVVVAMWIYLRESLVSLSACQAFRVADRGDLLHPIVTKHCQHRLSH